MADVILKAEHLKIGFFSERHSLFEKRKRNEVLKDLSFTCLLYTSPSPRDS